MTARTWSTREELILLTTNANAAWTIHVQTIITRATATTKTLADKTIAVYSQTNPCFPSRNWGLRILVMLMERDTTHLESWSVFDLFKIHKSINSKKEKIGSFSMRIGDCYTQSEVPKAQFSVFRSRKKREEEEVTRNHSTSKGFWSPLLYCNLVRQVELKWIDLLVFENYLILGAIWLKWNLPSGKQK